MSDLADHVEVQAVPAWFDIRPAAPTELPAVYEAWAGTYKRSKSAGVIPNHLFEQVTFTAITGLLQRGARIDALVAKSYPDTVLAWIAYEQDRRSSQPVVHYMFVKDGFRRKGLAKTLLAYVGGSERFVYTHETPFMKYFKGGYHNPGLARRKNL